MLDGKKSIAFKVFTVLDIVTKIEEEECFIVWEKSLENITPHVEVRSRRIEEPLSNSSTSREDRKVSLGMKWLIGAARNRNEKTMALNLASEIIAGYKEEGAAYKKKMDTHRMAEANKAFSHFRF